MAEAIILNASTREARGSAQSRRLRRAGHVPAMLAMLDETGRAVQLAAHEFEMMLRHHQSENLIIDLSVDGAPAIKALLKEVQHDSLSDDILHADFKEVSMTETLQVSITVLLTGEPVGVRNQGGILEQTMHEIEVEGRPGDLVESITRDVTELELGHSVHVSDLVAGPGLVITSDPEQVVATVLMPRVEEVAAEAEEEEGAEGAEEGAEGAEEGAEGAEDEKAS